MLALCARQVLGFLLLSNFAVARKFKFGVEEVNVGTTRDYEEDDVLLVIASTAGSGNHSDKFSLGPVEKNASIKWNNITQEFDVPSGASNLSVALSAFNADDPDEAQVGKFIDVAVTIAATFPGPQALPAKLLGIVLGFLDPTNCTGPVVLGNIIYPKNDLKNMDQNQKVCDTKTYSIEKPGVCGLVTLSGNSSYSVKYCLEALDPKSSAAANLVPSSLFSFAGLGVALLFAILLV